MKRALLILLSIPVFAAEQKVVNVTEGFTEILTFDDRRISVAEVKQLIHLSPLGKDPYYYFHDMDESQLFSLRQMTVPPTLEPVRYWMVMALLSHTLPDTYPDKTWNAFLKHYGIQQEQILAIGDYDPLDW